MTVTLYANKSDVRTLNKSLTTLSTLQNVRTLGENSVINPIFSIDGTVVPSSANYLHCPSYGRYYFINDITYTTGGRAIVHCSVDVLQTYSTAIRNCHAVVSRSESAGKPTYIPDNRLPLTGKTETKYIAFPNQNLFDVGSGDIPRYVLTTFAPNQIGG